MFRTISTPRSAKALKLCLISLGDAKFNNQSINFLWHILVFPDLWPANIGEVDTLWRGGRSGAWNWLPSSVLQVNANLHRWQAGNDNVPFVTEHWTSAYKRGSSLYTPLDYIKTWSSLCRLCCTHAFQHFGLRSAFFLVSIILFLKSEVCYSA